MSIYQEVAETVLCLIGIDEICPDSDEDTLVLIQTKDKEEFDYIIEEIKKHFPHRNTNITSKDGCLEIHPSPRVLIRFVEKICINKALILEGSKTFH